MRAHKPLRERRISLKRRESTDTGYSTGSSQSLTLSTAQTLRELRAGKRKCLSHFELSEIINNRKIRNQTVLLTYAYLQKREVKTDVADSS